MSTYAGIRTVTGYQWKNMARAKWLLGYTLFYVLLTEVLLRFAGSGDKVLLSLSNIMLFLIPIVGMLYGALHIYQSNDFTELLLAQPMDRSQVFWGLYAGMSIPLAAAFVIGAGLPLTWHGIIDPGLWGTAIQLLSLGAMLSLIMTALGIWLGLTFYQDKVKGLGVVLVLWLILGVLYDGLILLTVYLLGDYPLEQPVLIISMLNPIDLARIMVMLQFDVSALMGYTGAVFNRFFGSFWGMGIATGSLAIWLTIPLIGAFRRFKKMDF
ncbi:MAG: ABC transporter permease subunit [Bacteroidota bacterium]